ncbi:hypothetical protein CRG98_017776 [Punica granatum]|uniref:Uncharacterized protein n=1 Tax=Punica granatum TaxID=22663 RepID=A0A2I0JZZ5_PUNGR|nr:hypothetical protein CRG98_017776 [Punica granatum]
MHGRAGPVDLQEARVSRLGELAELKSKDARASRPDRFARSTSAFWRGVLSKSMDVLRLEGVPPHRTPFPVKV